MQLLFPAEQTAEIDPRLPLPSSLNPVSLRPADRLSCGAGVFAAFLAATILLLYLSGSFTHELGGSADEAAHFMTGLMIRDYVASGATNAPIEFAKDYYAHYPKLAFGIWPPLFHVMEAAWMMLISSSKASVLLMLGLITAMLAYLLFRTVERRFCWAAGFCAGLLLISVPLMQQGTGLVMVDSSVALFSFLAILSYGRYLDDGRWQDAVLFGIWSSAAILSKYNGLALALVPPLCAAFTGRWKLLWRGRTLLSAAIVLVICGSWYVPMRHLIAYAAEPLPHLGTVLPAMRMNAVALAGIMGIPLLMVAGAGVVFALVRHRNRGIWIAAAAFIVACWSFHSITIPDPEPRYLLPALAPLILFLAAGIEGLSDRLRCSPALMTLGLAVAYLAGTFTVMRTPHLGYAEVASAIGARSDLAQAIILADGEAESEGMAVSEIAIRERRPAHYVLRGSKVLASSTWMGANYRPLYATTVGVLDALDALGASAVIVQTNAPARIPHHRLLAEALQSVPGTWMRWSDAGWDRSQNRFLVYRRIRPIQGPFCVELSLEETLRRRMRICIPGQAN